MGLIKTAIMTGGGLYAVNKLAKVAETRQNNRPYPPNNNETERGSREYQSNSSQTNNWIQPPSPPPQKSRQLASGEQEQYWYLNNENVWRPLPREYSNMRSGSGPPYPEQRRLPSPDYHQQQFEFNYPQDQSYGYVNGDRQAGSRSMMSSDTANQAMGFVTNLVQAKSGGKKGKGDGTSDILSMFSK